MATRKKPKVKEKEFEHQIMLRFRKGDPLWDQITELKTHYRRGHANVALGMCVNDFWQQRELIQRLEKELQDARRELRGHRDASARLRDALQPFLQPSEEQEELEEEADDFDMEDSDDD